VSFVAARKFLVSVSSAFLSAAGCRRVSPFSSARNVLPLFSKGFFLPELTFRSVIKGLKNRREPDCKSLHPGSIPGEAANSSRANCALNMP
jgi:hypothetical protein